MKLPNTVDPRTTLTNGKSKTAHKKYAYDSFVEVFGDELKKRGFSLQYGAFHRAKGELYQSVGIYYRDRALTCCDVYLCSHPFWTNDIVFRKDFTYDRTYRTAITTHLWRDNLFREIDGDFGFFEKTKNEMAENDVRSFLQKSFIDYQDFYLDFLDNTKTPEDYVDTILFDDHFMLDVPDENAIKYVAFEKGDTDYLQSIYAAVIKKETTEYRKQAKKQYERIMAKKEIADYSKSDIESELKYYYLQYPDFNWSDSIIEETKRKLGNELFEIIQKGSISDLEYMPKMRAALAKFQSTYFNEMLSLLYYPYINT